MTFLQDRIHQLPRQWSNQELARVSHLFGGAVVNVSAWMDLDKAGKHYRDYFSTATSYTLTNYKPEARGFQGKPGEIFLDLEQALEPTLHQHFDTVFNHTTLEHVFDMHRAFANICAMSRDIVIIVLPFLQQYHADYGDFWRFSPDAIKRLFAMNGFELVYLNFNTHPRSSVYTFSIASRNPGKWRSHFPGWSFSNTIPGLHRPEPFIGSTALSNWSYRLVGKKIQRWFHKRSKV